MNNNDSEKLFSDEYKDGLNPKVKAEQGPVTCLGMEFENDEARRAYFREELRNERSPKILYDRLISYYVQHGYQIPMDAQEFQAGLRERFKVATAYCPKLCPHGLQGGYLTYRQEAAE